MLISDNGDLFFRIYTSQNQSIKSHILNIYMFFLLILAQ